MNSDVLTFHKPAFQLSFDSLHVIYFAPAGLFIVSKIVSDPTSLLLSLHALSNFQRSVYYTRQTMILRYHHFKLCAPFRPFVILPHGECDSCTSGRK